MNIKMDLKPSFDRYIILDGSTGINLQKAGMPSGVCPEKWILENPGTLISLQRGFANAGSDAVYAPTFGANRVKLKKYGLESRLPEINRELVKLSREAVGDRAAVGGNLSSLGVFMRPFGDYSFEMLVDVYAEQAQALENAGVDFFVAETLMSLPEARAALLAVKSVSDKPFVCSMTFEKNGRTLGGTEPAAALAVIQSMGADAFGLNCSTGPEDIFRLMEPLSDYTRIPLLSKPNAGIPETDSHGNAAYTMTGACFVSHTAEFARSGIRLFGGCCGTDASHIAELKKTLAALPADILTQSYPKKSGILAASEKNARYYEALPEVTGSFEINEYLADDIIDAGLEDSQVPLVLVNAQADASVFEENQYMISTPVCFDGDDDAVEKILRVCNARAFIKKSGRAQSLAEKYGAIVI